MKGLIFVISGPSGSGKTTLVQRIIRDRVLKNKTARSISLTTRPKRSKEKEGKDYFFTSKKQFARKLKAKKILEWTKYLGYYYATPKDFVERQINKGRHLILCLDFRGAQAIKRAYPQNTITIFIIPPSLEELAERIEKRCAKTKKEEIKKRIKLAKEELAVSEQYDYHLVNKELDKTVRELKKIIVKEITKV